MKLCQIEIYGFGQFEQQQLTFEEPLILIYGPNESGKSTLMRCIRALLFGFPSKKEEQRYQPSEGVRYGGKLCFEQAGKRMVIERLFPQRKKGVTLYQEEQEPLFQSEQQWLARLHPLTPTLFDEIFYFAGGSTFQWKELAPEQIQKNLLSIGLTGSDRLLKRQAELEKAERAYFRPTGTKPLLNQQVSAWKELQQQIQRAQEQQAAYQKESLAEEAAEQALTAHKEQEQQQQAKLERLQQQLQLFPQFERLQKLRFQLADARFSGEKRSEILEQLKQAEALVRSQKREREQAAWQELQQASPKVAFYRQKAPKIQELLRNREQIEGHHYQLQHVEAQQKELAEQQQVWAQEHPTFVHWRGSVEEREQLAVLAQQQQQLAQEAQALAGQVAQAESAVERLEQNVDQFERQTVPTAGPKIRWSLLGGGLALGCLVVAGIMRQPLLALAALILGGLSFWGYLRQRSGGDSQLAQEKAERYRLVLNELDQAQQERITLEKIQQEQEEHRHRVEQEWQWLRSDCGLPAGAAQAFAAEQPLLAEKTQLDGAAEKLRKQWQALHQQELDWKQDWQFLAAWLPVERLPLKELLDLVLEESEASQKDAQADQALAVFEQQQARFDRLLAEVNQQTQASKLIVTRSNYLQIIQELEKEEQAELEVHVLEPQLERYFSLNKRYEKAGLEEAQEQVRAQIVALGKQRAELEAAIQGHQVALAVRRQDTTLDFLYQQQEVQWELLQETSEKWQANRLAAQLIRDYLEKMAEHQLAQLIRSATFFFREATNRSYEAIELRAGRLEMKRADHRIFPLEALSSGTQIQLILAFRFAYIQLHGDELMVPLFLDDGWLHFDRERKAAFFATVAKLSQHVQVLLLSADETLKAWYNETKQARWIELAPLSEENRRGSAK